MEMIVKSKDKHGNQIEFNPKGRGARYTVNGLRKKGVTTIIGERFGKGALMWWAENCVYEDLVFYCIKFPFFFILANSQQTIV